MYSYLSMVTGPSTGTNYLLDPKREMRVGRGADCDIVLADPLSSRVHCVITARDGQWWIRDETSRNGTFVNDQKIDEAQLVDGSTMRIGSTEFAFRISPRRLNNEAGGTDEFTQTIIKDTPINPKDTGSFALEAVRDQERSQDLLVLFQLSVKLLACSDPDEVVRIALDLLQECSKASVVGFLWASDDGQLRLKHVLPEEAERKVSLSESLTKVVLEKKHAVWIANQTADDTASLNHFADAMCVPLIHEESALGAIHLYLEKGRFRQTHFDLSISLANILVVALVRARQQAILAADHQRLVAKSAGFDELVGDSRPMQELKARIARVAKAAGCVLVRGESGSGKELVARALHKASPRADRPMLSVNCAAIPAELMESQLFGHKKGAFTGADADHSGWFQQADSGTLFLDEVGEMTLEGQAKLLRILEGHPFLPVGATKEVRVDVRVIAATNRELREFVRAGKFREDLFYRLSVFELYIPPLRDRGPDIESLVTYFLDHFRRQHGRPALALSPAARDKLLGYAWPGNVRQLRNVIDSAVVMADGEVIEPDDLGLRDAAAGELETLRMDYWERKLITTALSRVENNVPEAAKLLGIGRATLYRKLEEYGIER